MASSSRENPWTFGLDGIQEARPRTFALERNPRPTTNIQHHFLGPLSGWVLHPSADLGCTKEQGLPSRRRPRAGPGLGLPHEPPEETPQASEERSTDDEATGLDLLQAGLLRLLQHLKHPQHGVSRRVSR